MTRKKNTNTSIVGQVQFGKIRISQTFLSQREADRWVARHKQQYRAAKQSGQTFAQLSWDYLEFRDSIGRSIDKRAVNRLVKQLPHLPNTWAARHLEGIDDRDMDLLRKVILHAVDAGKLDKSPLDQFVRLGELIDTYLKNGAPKSIKKRPTQLVQWKDAFGTLAVTQIKTDLLEEYLETFPANNETGKLSPKSKGTYAGALSGCFAWAIEKQMIPKGHNPAKPLVKGEANKREMFFSVEQKDTILDACQNHSKKWLYPLVYTFLGTGMREGAVLKMRVRDANLKQTTIHAPAHKYSPERDIPMADNLYDALRNWIDQLPDQSPDAWLWPSIRDPQKAMTHGYVHKWISQILVECGLRKLNGETMTTHHFRHTFATHLLENGVAVQYVSKLLGHSSSAVTLRVYAHVLPDRMRDSALSVLNDFL